MTTWTATELATQVLKDLGVTGVGQSASPEDTQKITKVYPSIYAQLRRLRLAPWPSGEIEEMAQLPLSKYLVGQLASSFGFSGQRLQEHLLTGQQGWIELQECAAGDQHPAPPKFKDY